MHPLAVVRNNPLMLRRVKPAVDLSAILALIDQDGAYFIKESAARLGISFHQLSAKIWA